MIPIETKSENPDNCQYSKKKKTIFMKRSHMLVDFEKARENYMSKRNNVRNQFTDLLMQVNIQVKYQHTVWMKHP